MNCEHMSHVVNYWHNEQNIYLCFRHAILAALNGDDIETEVAEYGELKDCSRCGDE